jgi:hypothetical protein
MGRKNKRIVDDTYLPPIKEERRSVPRCFRFPDKTVFTTGYRAQIAVDEIKARSDRNKVPVRVYECNIDNGGCGFFHTTSQEEYQENRNDAISTSYPDLGTTDYRSSSEWVFNDSNIQREH